MPTRLTCSRIAAALSLLIALAPVARAIEVTNNTDSAPGSLRAAISGTASGGTVTFNASVNGDTVDLVTSLAIPSGKTLTVDATNLSDGFTLNGQNAIRILSQAGTATISGLTFRNGRTTAVDAHGAAIANTGNLTLHRCVFRANNVGDAAGGAIENNGTLTANDCWFDMNNSNNIGGGAIDNFGGGSVLILNRCTFTGNRANDNNQNFQGDGGGAIFNNATLTATNCTFTGNLTNEGDGAVLRNEGTATFRHCTITGNTAFGNAGGIDNAGTLTLENTILSGNSGNSPDLRGTLTNDLGNNLVGGTVPALGAVQDNGGFVPTMLPLLGSTALDDATDLGTSPTTDARGIPRPGGGENDIGAAERISSLIVDTAVDENDGISTGGISLRDAIAFSEAGTITFAPGLGTIFLNGSELVIDHDLTIDASSVGGITIDAGEKSRVMQITSGNTVTLDSLTLSNGQADDGAGIHNSGSLSIYNSSFDHNSSANDSRLGGGGILHLGTGSLSIYNSSFAHNSANDSRLGGGGIHHLGSGSLSIYNSSFAHNSANDSLEGGGGILHEGSGSLSISNSIVAYNTAVNSRGPDIFGDYTAEGHNIVQAHSDGTVTLNGTVSTADPLLAPLGDYGGPTQTMPPLPGSPAIDMATVDPEITTDQRGVPRPVGPLPDIGAVESAVSDFSPAHNATAGNPTTLAWTGLAGATYQVSFGTTPGSLTSLGSTGTATSIAIPGAPLAVGTYFWRVDTTVGGVTYPGGEATFFTGVVTPADAVPGSLRQAIATAAPDDTILFDPAVFNGEPADTITLGGTQLLIDKSLTIDASALSDGITIDADQASRVMEITAGNTVTLDSLTLTGGKTANGSNGSIFDSRSGDGGDGGAIHNASVLTLRHCTLTGNTTGNGGTGGGGGGRGGDGGRGGFGGAIYNSSTATLDIANSTLSGNTSGNGGRGGGDDESNGGGGDGGGGGAIYIDINTTLDIKNSTLSDNTTGNGGIGGIVAGNGDGPGGDGGSGGAIFIKNGTVTLIHATLSGNTSGSGASSDDNRDGDDGSGGGIFVENAKTLNLTNSIVAGNTSTAGSPDIDDNNNGGIVNTTGANLVSSATGFTVNNGAAPIVADPLLASLGDYGGPTLTMPPLAGSPAIDAAGTTNDEPTDQRGFPRISNGFADIGAVEIQHLVVNTAADEDDGIAIGGISLRDALTAPPGQAEIIIFAPGLSGATITLTSGQLLIDKSLTIDASALANGITINADQKFRVMEIAAGNTVTLSLLSLSNGSTTTTGGGIKNLGTLHLSDVEISDCRADGDGAGLFNGTDDTVTATRCTFAGNTGLANGGGIHSRGSLALIQCSVSDNQANNGGGIFNATGKQLTIDQSTAGTNTATNTGGGIRNSGSLDLSNSIIADNTASNTGNDISNAGTGTLTRAGVNLIGNNTTVTAEFPAGTPNTNGDLVGANAAPIDSLLAPLGDYGGPTQTMPPLPGSPAIDTGTATSYTTDQRGVSRSIDGDSTAGALPDIGAVEFQPTTDLALFWNLDTDGDGNPFGIEHALGTDPNSQDPENTRNLTVPTFNPSGNAILTFGLNPAASPGTIWLLKRSTDLIGFTEIYRFDGTNDTPALNVSFGRVTESITVFDQDPPAGKAFYRFESVPPQ